MTAFRAAESEVRLILEKKVFCAAVLVLRIFHPPLLKLADHQARCLCMCKWNHSVPENLKKPLLGPVEIIPLMC